MFIAKSKMKTSLAGTWGHDWKRAREDRLPELLWQFVARSSRVKINSVGWVVMFTSGGLMMVNLSICSDRSRGFCGPRGTSGMLTWEEGNSAFE